LAELKEKMEKEISNLAPFGRDQNVKKMESFIYSNFTNEVRTFFQEKSKDFS
jgi:hypothetical protein